MGSSATVTRAPGWRESAMSCGARKLIAMTPASNRLHGRITGERSRDAPDHDHRRAAVRRGRSAHRTQQQIDDRARGDPATFHGILSANALAARCDPEIRVSSPSSAYCISIAPEPAARGCSATRVARAKRKRFSASDISGESLVWEWRRGGTTRPLVVAGCALALELAHAQSVADRFFGQLQRAPRRERRAASARARRKACRRGPWLGWRRAA